MFLNCTCTYVFNEHMMDDVQYYAFVWWVRRLFTNYQCRSRSIGLLYRSSSWMTRSKCLIIEHGYQVKKRHCYTRRVRRYQRLIRFGKSKKDRQNNLQKKKAKRTNNDLQNITHKTKDRVTRTPLKTGINSGAPEG